MLLDGPDTCNKLYCCKGDFGVGTFMVIFFKFWKRMTTIKTCVAYKVFNFDSKTILQIWVLKIVNYFPALFGCQTQKHSHISLR